MQSSTNYASPKKFLGYIVKYFFSYKDYGASTPHTVYMTGMLYA